MRYAAGLLVVGLAGLASGCVDRIVRLGDTDSAGSSSSSSSDTGDDESSTTEPRTDTEGPECSEPDDCPGNATCFEGVCVGTGELRVSLSWDYVSDLDLHVETPAGVHISFENPNAGGGILDVDDCIGGDCLDNNATHVENIFFPMQPPLGQYRIWVYNFDGKNGGAFTLQVSGAASATFNGSLPAAAVQSQIYTFEI